MLFPDCKVPPDSCSLWFSLCETLTVYFGSHIRYLRYAGEDRMGKIWPTKGALWTLREGWLCCLDLDLPLLVRWVLIRYPCQWYSWGICWTQCGFPRKYCDLIISWLKVVPWRAWYSGVSTINFLCSPNCYLITWVYSFFFFLTFCRLLELLIIEK